MKCIKNNYGRFQKTDVYCNFLCANKDNCLTKLKDIEINERNNIKVITVQDLNVMIEDHDLFYRNNFIDLDEIDRRKPVSVFIEDKDNPTDIEKLLQRFPSQSVTVLIEPFKLNKDDMCRFFAAGARNFIVKPITNEKLNILLLDLIREEIEVEDIHIDRTREEMMFLELVFERMDAMGLMGGKFLECIDENVKEVYYRIQERINRKKK